MPHSDDLLHWKDELPGLQDLGGKPGTPGFAYFYCDSAHEYAAQQEGWTRVPNSPVFTLEGPKGTHPFTVMQRGKKALGLSAESTAQQVYVSQHLLEATGLELAPESFMDGLPCFPELLTDSQEVEQPELNIPSTPTVAPMPVVDVR